MEIAHFVMDKYIKEKAKKTTPSMYIIAKISIKDAVI